MSFPKGDGSTLAWIAQTIGRSNVVLVLLLGMICLLDAAIGISVAFFLRDALDAAASESAREFWRALLLLAGIIMLQVIVGAMHRFALARSKASVETRLRGWSFDKILGQTTQQSSERHSGDFMTHMTSDVTIIVNGVTVAFPHIIYLLTRVVGVMIAMFILVPNLAPVFVAVGGVLGIVSLSCRGFLKRMSSEIQEIEGSLRSFLQDCLGNLLVIRSFGAEDAVKRENDRNMDEYKRARVKREDVTNIGGTTLGFVFQCGYILSFAWCGYGILEGTVSYGTLVAVIQVVGQLHAPFAGIGGMFREYSATMASAERLMNLDVVDARQAKIERSQIQPEAANPRALYHAMEKICVDNVTFGYGAEAVLSDFSCEVSKGEFATILGLSGAGKSTLMKLLLGAYSPDEGKVALRLSDGGEVPATSVPAGFFAYVPQGNCLMSGTIRAIVAFAKKDQPIDEGRLSQACEVACALEFIERLPHGFDTVLGEGGSGLSEGQRQRLAVARAVYSGAPVLLLDEATSALDADTERRMLASIKELGNRTIIVITHRPEALRSSDTVLRMSANCKET